MKARPRLFAHSDAGFTLVELLVSVAVIGVLVALLVPAVQQAREAARKSQCRNNLKQIGLALHNYHATHSVFPSSNTNDVEQGGWIPDPLTKHIHSWSSMILPYIDQTPLYHQIDYNVSSMDPKNLQAASQVISIYRCATYTGPSFSGAEYYTRFSPNYAIQNYVAMGSSDVGHIYGQNSGLFKPDGIIYPLSSTSAGDISDGLSNTVLIVETREEEMTVWIDGGTAAVVARRFDEDNPPTYGGPEVSLNFTPYFEYIDPKAKYGPSSMHTGGAFHLLGDGAVRFISQFVDVDVYVAIATRAGAETNATGNF